MNQLMFKIVKGAMWFAIAFMTPALIVYPKDIEQMKHAKFRYFLTEQGSRRCIIITDEGEFFGNNKTVTNDIEWVIDQIEFAERIRAEQFIIVYADASGRWDGFNARTQKFVILNAATWPVAVYKYIAEELQPQHA